jgi:hypothetical protein
VHILPQNTEFHEVDESEEEPKSQGKTGQWEPCKVRFVNSEEEKSDKDWHFTKELFKSLKY